MGYEGVEPVRQRIVLRPSARRRLDERLVLRFPRMAYAITRGVARLRPRSRPRRAIVRYVARRALEAANRGDYEVAFSLFPPDYETYPPPEMVGLGFEPVYRGPAERLALQLQWLDQLGEFRQKAKEVIDLGDRIVLLGWMSGTGAGSGAAFESEVSYLIEFAGTRLSRERFFRSHAEALEAAGLRD